MGYTGRNPSRSANLEDTPSLWFRFAAHLKMMGASRVIREGHHE